MPPRVDSFAPTGWDALTYDLTFGSDGAAQSPRANKKVNKKRATVDTAKPKMTRNLKAAQKNAVAEQSGSRQQSWASRARTLTEALAADETDARRGSPGAIQITQTQSVISSRSASVYSEQEVPPASDVSPGAGQHRRGESLHVVYSPEDVKRVSDELLNGTIAPVHLSLLGYWICESEEHYQIAKSYIRELSLDQGYNVERIKNVHLRKLLQDVKHVRPKEAMSKADCKLKHIPAIRSKHSHSSFKKTFPNPFADSQVLPPVLRGETRGSRNLDATDPLSSPSRDYPPNTPDRPEPLSVRSRGSGAASNLTPTPAHRTASSPVGLARFANLEPITYPRNTLILEDTEAHPLLAEHTGFNNASDSASLADDVFAPISDRNLRSSKSMINVRPIDLCRQTPNCVFINPDASHPPGRYRLQYSDLSNTSSYDGHASAQSIAPSESASNARLATNQVAGDDDEFDDLEEYAASDQSEFSDSGWFSSTDLCKASLDARNQRLISCELDNDGYKVDEVDNAFEHCSARTPCLEAGDVFEHAVRIPSSHSPNTADPASSSLSLSTFPLPPMTNPVGALPMAVVIASLASACGTLTFQTNHIRTLLQHTRARGANMARKDRFDMTAREQTWRTQHEELLSAIYGRWDVVLEEEDVAYVERIAGEVAGGKAGWVMDVLREGEGEGEMF